jgi:hypothetical protein
MGFFFSFPATAGASTYLKRPFFHASVSMRCLERLRHDQKPFRDSALGGNSERWFG